MQNYHGLLSKLIAFLKEKKWNFFEYIPNDIQKVVKSFDGALITLYIPMNEQLIDYNTRMSLIFDTLMLEPDFNLKPKEHIDLICPKCKSNHLSSYNKAFSVRSIPEYLEIKCHCWNCNYEFFAKYKFESIKNGDDNENNNTS